MANRQVVKPIFENCNMFPVASSSRLFLRRTPCPLCKSKKVAITTIATRSESRRNGETFELTRTEQRNKQKTTSFAHLKPQMQSVESQFLFNFTTKCHYLHSREGDFSHFSLNLYRMKQVCSFAFPSGAVIATEGALFAS